VWARSGLRVYIRSASSALEEVVPWRETVGREVWVR
jgi:hypothetical protein